jgi:hypothetical protein
MPNATVPLTKPKERRLKHTFDASGEGDRERNNKAMFVYGLGRYRVPGAPSVPEVE